MPLPFLIAGAVVLSTVAVVKSKIDFDEAEDINRGAKSTYDQAAQSLDQCRDDMQSWLEKLGKTKLALMQNILTPFVTTFSRIKNVNYDGMEILEEVPEDIKVEIMKTQNTTTSIEGAVGGALLGGGTVLGGIVAAPVLLVGGLVLASRAAKVKEDAFSNLAKAKAAAEAMQTAEVTARAIERMAREVVRVLLELEKQLGQDLSVLQHVVANNEDYRTYSRRDQELVVRTVSLAVTAKNVAETPLLEEDGAVTDAIGETLRNAKKMLGQIKHM